MKTNIRHNKLYQQTPSTSTSSTTSTLQQQHRSAQRTPAVGSIARSELSQRRISRSNCCRRRFTRNNQPTPPPPFAPSSLPPYPTNSTRRPHRGSIEREHKETPVHPLFHGARKYERTKQKQNTVSARAS
ncbi:unnamed protein product, partial [Iphiclides podalirius]